MDAKQEEKLLKLPEIDTKVSLSKDKSCVIIKTTITKIYAKKYFDVMFANDTKPAVTDTTPQI